MVEVKDALHSTAQTFVSSRFLTTMYPVIVPVLCETILEALDG